jgi:hypothetical protein
MSHTSQRGFTLAEALVGLTATSVILIMGLTLLDYGRRIAGSQADIIEAEELSRSAVTYVTSIIREAEVGTTAGNPANCLSCHVDADGALTDNPATACPEDMITPQAPIRIATLNVDPNDPNTSVPAEPGNALQIDVDRAAPPTGLPSPFVAERRTIFPTTLPSESYMELREWEDHDRDGTSDQEGPIIHGVQNVSFELLRTAPPAWAIGAQVTPSCSSNPAGCHGTGNANLGGDDIYGTGVFNGPGTLGEVWTLDHPDSQAIRGVVVHLTAASQGRTMGGQLRDFTRTLRVAAIPRRLQQ